MGSEFQDLLESTEESLGDPIDQNLASVMEQTWGKCLLSTEKRTALWKGINIPSNCKVLKAKDLNTKIQIRVNENAWKKDKRSWGNATRCVVWNQKLCRKPRNY